MTAGPTTPKIAQLRTALPFWLSLGLIPLAILAAVKGGWFIALLPLSTWYLFSALDYVVGQETDNPDTNTPESQLFWYRLITLIWAPLQIVTIFGILAYVTATDHLARWEEWALFAALGILSGTVGIVYSHELMHQKPRMERWLADGLNTCWSITAMSARHVIQFLRAMAKAFTGFSCVYCLLRCCHPLRPNWAC